MADATNSLITTATTYSEDIAMACYLHSQVAPTSPTPGDIISWICRLQPAAMLQDADNLKALALHLDKIDATQVRDLYEGADPGWEGPAGLAFKERWENDFLTYVGKDGASGLRLAFKESERMLYNIANQAERLQEKCQAYIEDNLVGLRERFITACQDDEEAMKFKELKATTELIIGGIQIAVSGDNPVDKMATAVGQLVGAVFTFMTETVTDARDALKVSVGNKTFDILDATDALVSSAVIGYRPYSNEERIPYES